MNIILHNYIITYVIRLLIKDFEIKVANHHLNKEMQKHRIFYQIDCKR